ncbi:uncharacterized protein SCHCODRAFT_02591537 [Schizophyllum commune H4-8]|nr:uncharacterized protein SCHCODRAFT_02591537 [Schizophyllum commune H4-8]KAI5886374.1 hypothetical protein SCHCODRAFT_02591537 [Schizophyllum commune H4-8]
MKHPRVVQADTELIAITKKLDALRLQRAGLQLCDVDETLRLKRSIDEEVQELEERRHDLELETIPIYWLPNEVLACIFTDAAEHDLASISDKVANWRRALPITLSHVCSRWRSVALVTRELWSFILIRDVRSPLDDSVSAFLKRSGDTCSLDVLVTIPSTNLDQSMKAVAVLTFTDFLKRLPCRRLRALLIRCGVMELGNSAVYAINNFPIVRQSIKHLDLALLSDTQPPDHLFAARNRILEDIPDSCLLRSMRLRRIPMQSLHSWVYIGLQRLELTSYPPSLHLRPPFTLTVSSLRSALRYTSQLEELVLCDAVPVFDLPLDAGNYKPLALNHLRRLEWSYPGNNHVQGFLYLFNFPALEDLDISVIHDVSSGSEWQGYRCLPLPKLERLALTCLEDAVCLLRQCEIAQLKRLEIIGGTACLDNFLRDPRLEHLTHLLLSEVTIEPGIADQLLGYLPQLVSLTLEHVHNVDPIFTALQKTIELVPFAAEGPAATPVTSVRFCPRLKEIALWKCMDATGRVLLQFARFRNGVVKETASETSTTLAAGHLVQSSQPATSNARRPVRRLPRKRQDTSDVQKPCKIDSVVVEDCPEIGKGVPNILRGLGIVVTCPAPYDG